MRKLVVATKLSEHPSDPSPEDDLDDFSKILEKVCCPFYQIIAIAQVITTASFLYKAKKYKEI